MKKLIQQNKLGTIKNSFKAILIFSALLAFVPNINGQTNCNSVSIDDFYPEFSPIRTLRVAFHVIHRDSIGDTTNIPDDSTATAWWNLRIDSVNRYYSNMSTPNYPHFHYDVYDSKIRIEKYGVYHHVDPYLYSYTGGSVPIFYNTLIANNPTYNAFEKDSVIHCFYYNSNGHKWGGAASGIPDKRAIRFSGRFPEFKAWKNWEPIGHKRNDGNLIHELGHNLGVSHNYQGTSSQGSQYTAACDYKLNGNIFNEDTNNVVNNYMYKGPGQTMPLNFTYCQVRRMQYYAHGWNRTQVGTNQDLSMISYAPDPCSNTHLTVLDKPSGRDSSYQYVLDYALDAHGDIEIHSGIELIVKCELRMPAGSKITVYPGAVLNVDGGTITSNPGCNDFWQGIVVEGSSLYSQYGSTPSGYPHGIVVLKNGALIENATVGIKTIDNNNYALPGGGAIVRADNSTFRNNIKSVHLGEYSDLGANKGKRNLSNFKNCLFEWDSTYLDLSKPIKQAIEMVGVNQVAVDSCTFINNSPSHFIYPSHQGNGIWAVDASARIKNCTFKDVYRGVYAGAAMCSAPVWLEDNVFRNCSYGGIINKADMSVVQQNSFINCEYSLNLAETKAFKVTENTFLNGDHGIYTQNLLKHSNELYNNTFTNLDYGIKTAGYAPKSNSGLSYKCNTFGSNTLYDKDIQVYKGEVDVVQGNCRDNDPELSYISPAGNEFSHTCTNLYDDFYAWNHSSKITYSHHNQTGTGPYKPDCYTSNTTKTNQCFTNFSSSKSCPDSSFLQSFSSVLLSDFTAGVATVYSDFKDEYNSQKSNYNSLLDGGNTMDLLDVIDPANDYSSSEIKASLDEHIPYLSDEVIQASIDRDPALVGSDLYQILRTSSPLSIAIANQIDGLTAVLTNTQIADLLTRQGGLTNRDELENEVRWNEQQAELALNELIRAYAIDTLAKDSIDVMIAHLEDWGSNETQEMLIPLYWENEDYSEAQDAITALDEQEENESLVYIMQSIHDVLEAGDSLPVLLPDTAAFESIATDNTLAGQSMAQNLMYRLTGKQYELSVPDTVVGGPRSGGENTVNSSIELIKVSDEFQIYPNPNDGNFILSWKTANPSIVKVFDLQGREVFVKEIESNKNNIDVSLPNDAKGVCNLVIYNAESAIIYKHKIVVNE